MEQDTYRFKVNLGGMIEILSDHLYSSPDVYIRELLQNSTDAIVARQKQDESFDTPEIRVYLQQGQKLRFHDNGMGLTKEEIHQFLAIIGESSKRDIITGNILEEYIGRFGIGLLSYFMVSDEIVVETKSLKDGMSLRWIGKPDGTYTLEEIEGGCEEGTTILLSCKSGCEDYFTSDKVKELILHYGILLPFPVIFDDGSEHSQMNRIYLPWDEGKNDREEILLFGKLMFGIDFMDYIVLDSESGNITGVAYVLPFPVQGTRKGNHRIFLKNMLLTEKGDNILPDWAVFVQCIINTNNLRPTASREGFYEDELLAQTRNEIGQCISNYIRNLQRQNKMMLEQFLQVHQQVLKSMAIEDDELFRIFFPYFEFVSTKGRITGKELLNMRIPIVYTRNVDEFKQMSQIFFAQGKLLIDGGYVYDSDILVKTVGIYGMDAARLETEEVIDIMGDVKISESENAVNLLRVARRVLEKYDCKADIKKFSPSTSPAFYYIDKQAMLLRKIKNSQEMSSGLFAGMLSEFARDIKEEASSYLYFNYNNPVVTGLCKLEDEEKLERFIELLYVQTILIGNYPMQHNEIGILNSRIMELIQENI